MAAARFLLSHGASVLAIDRRTRGELSADVDRLEASGAELVLGPHPKGIGGRAELVVVSPGVPLEARPLAEARQAGVPVWGELELGFRALAGRAKLVAVTGTKGKSTTSTWIAEMLRASGHDVVLAGNIGAPLVGALGGETTSCVVEVSSFQLATTETFRPDVAVLLDVTADHLDWHPSFEHYVASKERLFRNQTKEDWAVVFGDSRLTTDMAERAPSKKLYFSTNCLGDRFPHLHVEGSWIVRHEGDELTPLLRTEELDLPGRHNVENLMAATGAAILAGADLEGMEAIARTFEGLPHALEKVAEVRGVHFYNDSKATNIQAVKAAIESFDTGVLLILGGRFKGGDFRELRELVASKVKRVLALGESRQLVVDALKDVVPISECESLDDVLETAFGHAQRGDTVLLSPAGSSFDMFTDYRARGEAFSEAVRALKARVEE